MIPTSLGDLRRHGDRKGDRVAEGRDRDHLLRGLRRLALLPLHALQEVLRGADVEADTSRARCVQ